MFKPWVYWGLTTIYALLGIGYIIILAHPRLAPASFFVHWGGVMFLIAAPLHILSWFIFRNAKDEAGDEEKTPL